MILKFKEAENYQQTEMAFLRRGTESNSRKTGKFTVFVHFKRLEGDKHICQ